MPDVFKEKGEFKLASEFIEHYHDLLKLANSEAVADTLRLTKERGLKYIIGNDSRLASLDSSEDFSISLTNGVYNAQWSRHGEPVLACTFPARMELLTFSNKIELEDMMLDALTNSFESGSQLSRPTAATSLLTKVDYSPFYVRDLGYYITPRLSHQVIYQPVDSITDMCELLIESPIYVLECLSNMMLTGYSTHPITCNVKVDRYGYKSTTVALKLDELYQALSAEGSVPYWGVEKNDGTDVKGLYVWLNQSGGFAHVLSVNIPIASLSSPSELKASMHCYIRLDNLKSLFEEYQ